MGRGPGSPRAGLLCWPDAHRVQGQEDGDHTWGQAVGRRRCQNRGAVRVCRTTWGLLTSDGDKPLGGLLTGKAGNRGQEEFGIFLSPERRQMTAHSCVNWKDQEREKVG